MTYKYIVITPDKGVFLGALSGYALFSVTNPMGMYNAFGFESKEVAEDFVAQSIPSIANTAMYVEVDTPTKYVSCVDIIKAGYKDYTHNMMDFLEMPSQRIH